MRTFGLGLLAVLLCAGMLISGIACEDKDDQGQKEGKEEKETQISFDDLPKAVQDAVKAKYPDAKIEEVVKDEEDGKTVYDIELEKDGKDIELEVRYNVAATHLRDLTITFLGCDGSVGSDAYWHHHVNDNNKVLTWKVTMPASKHEGGYRFYLEGRSRAYNGVGGLATNWYFDPLRIWRGNSLHVVILDS